MAERSPDRSPEPFLARWSRLKGERREPEQPTAEPPIATAVSEGSEPVPAPTDADMPALESLDADSDYACFMSTGVSEPLRARALRKLFSLPMFGQLDGLNDYDDDYSSPLPLGDTVTYQMRQWAEQAVRRVAEHREPAPNPDASSTVPDPEASPRAGPESRGGVA